MRDLIRAAAQFACEVTIYAAERILEYLAARRPMHDDPLPEGHAEQWPDVVRPVRATLVFDTRPVDRFGYRRPDGSMPPLPADPRTN